LFGHGLVETALSIWWSSTQSESDHLARVTLDGKAPMNSAPKLKATGSNNGLVALADEQLAHAYEQITRADE
jgi:hypothetical protein